MTTLQAEETKIVTIDGQPRPVDVLPEEARQLVRFYDHWKQEELEARSRLLEVQTAMRAMAAQIAQIVQDADAKAAEERAAAEGAQAEVEAPAAEAAEDAAE